MNTSGWLVLCVPIQPELKMRQVGALVHASVVKFTHLEYGKAPASLPYLTCVISRQVRAEHQAPAGTRPIQVSDGTAARMDIQKHE